MIKFTETPKDDRSLIRKLITAENLFMLAILVGFYMIIDIKSDEEISTKIEIFTPLCKAECKARGALEHKTNVDTLIMQTNSARCKCRYQLGAGEETTDGEWFKIYENRTTH